MTDTADAIAALSGIPGGWCERALFVGERRFDVVLPAAPDEFLDDPEVLAENRRDDFMPYWAYLWPAATPLAEAILRADWPAGARTLELGAGIGLPGLAAAAAGLRVTFSDYRREPVDLAMHNARRHGYDAAGMLLDWRSPRAERFPLILASDVLYELRNHEPILRVLAAMLEPGGTCWIGDAGRAAAEPFPAAARAAGFEVALHDRAGRPRDAMPIGEFRLLIVTREAS
ncbi:MAG: methyltransferase domain-containing protein [Planctomycetaceae bacterium]